MENPQEPRFFEAKLNLPPLFASVSYFFSLSWFYPPSSFALDTTKGFKCCVWLAGRGFNIPEGDWEEFFIQSQPGVEANWQLILSFHLLLHRFGHQAFKDHPSYGF